MRAERRHRQALELVWRSRVPDGVPIWTRTASGLVRRHADRWSACTYAADKPGTTFHEHHPTKPRTEQP
jgi:hypothetical protein